MEKNVYHNMNINLLTLKNSQQSTKKISYQTSHVMKYGLGEAHSRLELTSTNI
jgi:hypothetical protein